MFIRPLPVWINEKILLQTIRKELLPVISINSGELYLKVDKFKNIFNIIEEEYFISYVNQIRRLSEK